MRGWSIVARALLGIVTLTTPVAASSASASTVPPVCQIVDRCWTTTPTPTPAYAAGLGGVSCPTPDYCVAVGDFAPHVTADPLAETWDGTRWSRPPLPVAHGYLADVSCATSSSCLAVGSKKWRDGYLSALVLSWNGASWRQLRIPRLVAPGALPEIGNYVQLQSVACPLRNYCLAVGNNGRGAVAIEWDGKYFSLARSPNPNFGYAYPSFDSVDCLSATYCVAVGRFASGSEALANRIVADRWDGQRWHVQKSPDIEGVPAMNAVSCASPAFCVAVTGNGASIDANALTWNGRQWSLSSPVQPGSSSQLTGISCPTTTDCITVGESWDGDGQHGLAEAFDGKRWTQMSTASETRVTQLNRLSCPSDTSCMATGWVLRANGRTSRTHAEHYDAIVQVPL
jgi:hypothetical protein